MQICTTASIPTDRTPSFAAVDWVRLKKKNLSWNNIFCERMGESPHKYGILFFQTLDLTAHLTAYFYKKGKNWKERRCRKPRISGVFWQYDVQPPDGAFDGLFFAKTKKGHPKRRPKRIRCGILYKKWVERNQNLDEKAGCQTKKYAL